jgi:hypothetical protein
VARRHTVKIPASLKAKAMLGHSSKGIKWGLGAAGAAYAAKKLSGPKADPVDKFVRAANKKPAKGPYTPEDVASPGSQQPA